LYHHQLKTVSNKIVLYDEFESEKSDIDGAITSRYEPVDTNADTLHKCQKIDNLTCKKSTPMKKKSKDEGEKRMGEVRTKKK